MGRMSELAMGYPASDDEIKAEYFEWLTYIVGLDRNSMLLAKELHGKEFYSVMGNDYNRAEDGKHLRDIFADESFFRDYTCLDMPCSVLEMLIALAIRIEAILEEPDIENRTQQWFWELLRNLGLDKFTDDEFYPNGGPEEVNRILTDLMERQYSRNGQGGLFPLKVAKKDQRKVEIWYQLSAYLLENYIDSSDLYG